MVDITQFLKSVLSVSGLSGYESPVREIIRDTWKPLVDEIAISRMGSLHALKKGSGEEPRRRVMLSAHMDSIGLLVTKADQGFIHFTQIGGIDPRILPGTPVTVHGRRDLPGIIAAPADILLPPRESGKAVDMEFLVVDTGLLPDEVEKLVRTGDLISFANKPIDLAGESISGHTLDNRASVAAVTQCLVELQHMQHDWDVYAVASTQEETSLTGAYTSSFELRPDIAIAIDVTFAKGPGANDYRSFPLGKATPIGWGPDLSPQLFRKMVELCDSLEIPYAKDILPRHCGTDAYAIQVTAEGIPCLLVEIPLRYMHTPVEMVTIKDVIRAGHIIAEFVARLTPDFVEQLVWED